MSRNFPKILKEDIVMPLATGLLFATGYVDGNRFNITMALILFGIMLACDIWESERDLV